MAASGWGPAHAAGRVSAAATASVASRIGSVLGRIGGLRCGAMPQYLLLDCHAWRVFRNGGFRNLPLARVGDGSEGPMTTRAGRGPGAPAFLASLALLAATGLSVPATDAASGDAGTLATADTYVSVAAGERSPRVTAFGTPGGPVWINRIAEALPEGVVVRGAPRRLTWRFDRAGSHLAPLDIELVYTSDAPHLKARWRWRARAAYGPLEHTIVLENHSEDTVWLPLQASLRFDWATAQGLRLNRFWVEKGADTPSAAGVHLDELRAGERWQGTSSTYARPLPKQPREMIPYVLVTEPDGAQRGWFVGIEFSGRTRILLERTGDSLRGEAGLNPEPGPYRTRLPPGATFVTPAVFLGTSSGGADGAGNILRRWVREVLGNPRTRDDPAYPLTVSNSWGSGMAVDETLARRMIVDAAQLGLEMFHLDAGWFRGVGDWQADAAKFPHGIASVADFAHAHGLKFGLWVDWTQAGTSREPGALNVYDPATRDWLIADPPAGWQHTEPFKGITTDLGLPAVEDWARARAGTAGQRLITSTCSSTTAIWWHRAARAQRSSGCATGSVRRCASTRTPATCGSTARTRPTSATTPAAPTTKSTSVCVRATRSCCWRSATTAAGWWISAAPRTATTSPSLIPMIRCPTAARSTTPASCCRRRC